MYNYFSFELDFWVYDAPIEQYGSASEKMDPGAWRVISAISDKFRNF